MKKISICIVCACAVLMTGCKAKQSITKTDAMVGYEEVAKSRILVMSEQSSPVEFRAYGEGESPKEQLAMNIARTQATAALQQIVETNVKSALDQYIDQTEVNQDMNLDVKTRNITQTAVKGIINGAMVKDSRKLYNSATGMYKYEVCMVYDKQRVLSAIEAQDARILANRDRFEKEMQNAWDELDRQNGRTPEHEIKDSIAVNLEARKAAIEQDGLDRQNEREINKINAQANADVAVINAMNAGSVGTLAPSSIPPYMYTISANGQNYGPYNYEQLQSMAAARQITPDTYIWREGMATWSTIRQMSELKGLFAPAPVPARAPAPVPVR